MLPQTTPEQRRRFYEDVEALLNPGFLTHPVVVAGVPMQIRSLGPGDLFMLRARGAGCGDHEWRVWMVASSLWMVKGHSVLGHDSAVPFMADYLRRLPAGPVAALFSLVLGLFARTRRAMRAVETYCFEPESRYGWTTYGRGQPSRFTGVPGAQTLGVNQVQQIWTAFNLLEDRRQIEEQQWEGHKLVASSNAPKAIKKVDGRDQQRRAEEGERRQKRLDLFYYQRLGVVDDKGEAVGQPGSDHRIQGAKSVEDLEDEMRRWVTEDYDLHDAVVAEYKARIRVQHEQEKQEREARRMALERKRAEMGWETGDFQPQPLVAMTAEQLQQMLMQRDPGQRGVSFIPKPPNADRLYDKYVGEAATDAGNLQVVDGKVIDVTANPETDARTLNQLIRDRNPSFGAGD